MDNYGLHEKAQQMEDFLSSYQLARIVLLQGEIIEGLEGRVLEQKSYIAQLEANLDKIREHVNESN